MAPALGEWVRPNMPNGNEYRDCDGSSSFFEALSNSFDDSTNTTPILFSVSRGHPS